MLVTHIRIARKENDNEAAGKTNNEARGDDTVAQKTARKWFAKFKVGENIPEDQSLSDRSQEVDCQTALEMPGEKSQ
ncbi:hypothetical protein KIN20_012635 [Parelaphostrongylus tenuis]|uniref:Mos1 transposase HTH domain-containing protein n=1 Tax=Parelaphostrongylus tenuis TaxID=148309 RepID=A0AAD5MCG0_PARTN|nr:hypothetical protein KIN20_012635 [Parelaphostrongylus tenuis]